MKKFKYLYTDGCSHTAGGGMENWKMDIINCYKEKYNIDIKHHRDCAWPKLLATKLNLKLEDRSESGAGADRIWRQAWEYCNGNLEKAKETIFILEVPSFLNRSDVRFKDDKWVICNTEWNDDGEIDSIEMVDSYDSRTTLDDLPKKKELYTKYLTTFTDYGTWEQSVYFKLAGLISYFRLNNIKFYIIPNGIYYTIFKSSYGLDIDENLLKVNYKNNSYNEFTGLANQNGLQICNDLSEYNDKYEVTKDGHPGYFAHKIWADGVYEFLSTQNLEDSKI